MSMSQTTSVPNRVRQVARLIRAHRHEQAVTTAEALATMGD